MSWTKRQAERKFQIQRSTTSGLVLIISQKAGSFGPNIQEELSWAMDELEERFKHIDEPRIAQLKLDWEEKEKAEQT